MLIEVRSLVIFCLWEPRKPLEWKWSRSVVSDSATPWTVAHEALLSMGFFRQESWSGLPFPPPGDLPDPGIEPRSPTLQGDSLPSEPRGKPRCSWVLHYINVQNSEHYSTMVITKKLIILLDLIKCFLHRITDRSLTEWISTLALIWALLKYDICEWLQGGRSEHIPSGLARTRKCLTCLFNTKEDGSLSSQSSSLLAFQIK